MEFEVRLIFKAIGFIILIIIGVPSNVFILAIFIHTKITEKKLLPSNAILTMLALVNLLVIITKGIPQAIHSIGIRNILNDTECKLFSFMYRICRGMTICVTSLLSCNQCVILAPPSKSWLILKQKISPNLPWIMLCLWSINIAIYPSCLIHVRAIGNYTTSKYTLHLEFCNHDFMTFQSYVANGIAIALRDFSFVGSMTLASCYIVFTLHRHGKQVQGMRSSDKNPGKSVEYKASRAVVLLVTIYVALFGLDSCIWIYTLIVSRVSPAISDARVFFGTLYAALSPVVIIKTNKKIKTTLICNNKKEQIHSTDTTTTDSSE
ncbi:olfactory receptor class A-like protein 1 [Spea bombifrons]|uniref:olfactory receptor class A-like protein 1 n=1 Tax=Spea bombifrons TaxID=233779 RepID=UPI00234B7F1A|nr:olfactory receptor class A-like protein 1 [Spea bombifrons]